MDTPSKTEKTSPPKSGSSTNSPKAGSGSSPSTPKIESPGSRLKEYHAAKDFEQEELDRKRAEVEAEKAKKFGRDDVPSPKTPMSDKKSSPKAPSSGSSKKGPAKESKEAGDDEESEESSESEKGAGYKEESETDESE